MSYRFSIIVPIYNVERFLPECISSILAQDFDDYEVILVNDGSPDRCPEICKEFQQKSDKIKIINQENKGLFLTRFSGMRKAEGEYIVHVDADDFCPPYMLSTLDKKIKEYNSDLVIYNYSVYDENSKIIRTEKNSFSEEKVFQGKEKEEIYLKLIFETVLNNIWIKCARKDLYELDKDYTEYSDVMMGEDVLHTSPILKNAQKILYLPIPLYNYRGNTLGMSRNIKEDYIFNYLKVRMVLYTQMNEAGFGYLNNTFLNRYVFGLNHYLLRVCKVCKSYADYKRIFNKVKTYNMQKIALANKKKWSFKNKITYIFFHPFFYPLMKLGIKIAQK